MYFAHLPIADNNDAVGVVVFSLLKLVEIHTCTLSVFSHMDTHSLGVFFCSSNRSQNGKKEKEGKTHEQDSAAVVSDPTNYYHQYYN